MRRTGRVADPRGARAQMNTLTAHGRKIFFIGFNRCGTTALHRMLARSGVNSMHFRVRNGPHLTSVMFNNFSLNRPLIAGLEEYEAFSDMNLQRKGLFLEGHRLFRQLHGDYPSSYFILNTRDRERWIESRRNHAAPGGTMVDYVRGVTGQSADEVLTQWRVQWDAHHAEVEAYFVEQDARFLKFDIEADSVSRLAEFLAEDVALNTDQWKRRNAGVAAAGVA